jgi:signal transduction histidine kinase
MAGESREAETLAHRLGAWLDEADALAASRPVRPFDQLDSRSRSQLELINKYLEMRVAERSGLLRVLHDVTAIVNEAKTIDGAFRSVLRRVAEHIGWRFGHVYLVSQNDPDVLVRSRAYFEEAPERFMPLIRRVRPRRLRRGESLPGRVLESGESVWTCDKAEAFPGFASDEAGLAVKTAAAFPAAVEGEVLAVFEFLSDRVLPPDQRVLDSMSSVGTHLGLFIIRKRMKRRIAELATQEQQRIGRDLHDDLGQQLTGIALLAKSLERDLRKEGLPQMQRAAEIARGLKEAQTHVQLLARGLVPVALDGEGLMKALEELARESRKRLELDVQFEAKTDTLVNDIETATQLYRIAQEAVTNAAKHGRATEITIALSVKEDSIHLEIRDNGVGISDQAIRKLGVGMSTMVYRSVVIGGELAVERAPGGGTVVCCVVGDEARDSQVE